MNYERKTADYGHDLVRRLTTLTAEDKQAYYRGDRRPDCTTLAIAAGQGELEFLKWCREQGYMSVKDDTVLGYAPVGKHDETLQWVEKIWLAPGLKF